LEKLKTGMIDKKKRRVIFFYSTKFSGHYHAACAIEKRLNEVNPTIETLDIETIDFFSPKLGRLVHKTYLGLIKKSSILYDRIWDNQKIYNRTVYLKELVNQMNQGRFRKLFDNSEASVAVCTQAFPCGIISKLKKDRLPQIKLIAVITDYDVHSYWVYDNVDYYTVPTEKAKEKLMRKGVDQKKIKVTGIPIKTAFAKDKSKNEIKEKLNLDKDKPVILVMGGSHGLGPLFNIVLALNEIEEDFQLLVVCGTNKKLKKELDSQVEHFHKQLRTYGYVDNIDELMTASDLLITKSGGLTITEALVKKKPMIIYDSIGGQESRNYRFLTDNQMAAESKSLRTLKAEVIDLLKNPQRKETLVENINSFVKENAADEIVKVILKSI
jgi:processive 1,2-diacylglycerol beta-glucosyltransferase